MEIVQEAQQRRHRDVTVQETERKGHGDVTVQETEQGGHRDVTVQEAELGGHRDVTVQETEQRGHGDVTVQETEQRGHRDVTVQEAELGGHRDVTVQETEQRGHWDVTVQETEQRGHWDVTVQETERGGHRDVTIQIVELGGHRDVTIQIVGLGGHRDVTVQETEQGGQRDVTVQEAELGGQRDVTVKKTERRGHRDVTVQETERRENRDVTVQEAELGGQRDVTVQETERGGHRDVTVQEAERRGHRDVTIQETERGGHRDVTVQETERRGHQDVTVQETELGGHRDVTVQETELGGHQDVTVQEAEQGGHRDVTVQETERRGHRDATVQETERRGHRDVTVQETERGGHRDVTVQEMERRGHRDVTVQETERGGHRDVTVQETERRGHRDVTVQETERGGQRDVTVKKTERRGQRDVTVQETERRGHQDVTVQETERGGHQDVTVQEAERGGHQDVTVQETERGGHRDVTVQEAERGGHRDVTVQETERRGHRDATVQETERGGHRDVTVQETELGGHRDVTVQETELGGHQDVTVQETELEGHQDVTVQETERRGHRDVTVQETERRGHRDVTVQETERGGHRDVTVQEMERRGHRDVTVQEAELGGHRDVTVQETERGGHRDVTVQEMERRGHRDVTVQEKERRKHRDVTVQETERGGHRDVTVQETKNDSGTRLQNFKTDVTRRKEQEKMEELLSRLGLLDRFKKKLTPAEFHQIKPTFSHDQELRESDLCSVYLHKLLMLDYRARYIQAAQQNTNIIQECEEERDLFEDSDDLSEQIHIHPMDIQMAVLHCSDSFLKQKIVTKLSQCQYALPLLVPNPLTGEIECPLWTFREIQKTWKKTQIKGDESVTLLKSMPICKAETPMVLCFRLGSLSESKSQLINTLINDRHSTFFHRNCTGSTRSRFLFDGVAEISWYCPAGKPNDTFLDCVAFCNLHGDGLTYDKQLNTLMDKASVNVVFIPTLEKSHKSSAVVKSLFSSSKPLLVLIENSGNSVTLLKKGKYKVGLKERSQSNVSEELRKIIRGILSEPHESFKLESMSDSGVQVDEQNTVCSKGSTCANEIMSIVKSASVSDLKERSLPCQGQMWHDYGRITKELFFLKGNVEQERSQRQKELNSLRESQCQAYGKSGELMRLFVEQLASLGPTERGHFLKWTQIKLDMFANESLLAILQSYNQKLSEVLHLKKKSESKKSSDLLDEQKTSELSHELESKQKELAQVSQDLHSATCGLEHIFREMAQIYEAHKSLGKPQGEGPADWSTFPELAAELMMSGHPMELMDGDAGHVPLTWIKSLMEQLVLELGDKRVFVLSILGIQSSGKSTMLNAMFGLQFAVSAGRCTRGAFMQLVKLSENIMEEFQWEYLLVVDTEGLRALELDGNQTLHHDNELATFVVGLGNMTLVNIFGENPSDMQDVLQIVVQAFMRMREVKLSPSCVFVHQNVTDVSASEKNMDGKRKLQDKLDKMVQLAAKEEVRDAGSFSDIIDFDVQKDVKYFAQLWEGSPPMAPPNPGYSDCVQELKSYILEKGKTSAGVTLQEFKTKIGDLWNALLNENFVFNFKNTLEIATYRKLEVEYGHWTWTLRSEMLKIEEKLYTEISNGKLDHVDSSLLHGKVKQKSDQITLEMSNYFDGEENKEMLIQWRGHHEIKVKDFLDELVKELQKKLNNVLDQKKASKEADEKKTVFESNLLKMSKDLALQLKDNLPDEQGLKDHFDHVWKGWVGGLTKDIKPPEPIYLEEDQARVIHEQGFEMNLIMMRKESQEFKHIAKCGDYTQYVAKMADKSGSKLTNFFMKAVNKVADFLAGHLPHENQEQLKALIKDVETKAVKLMKDKPVVERGYSASYLREMSSTVFTSVAEFESQWKYLLLKEFKVDLILFVFDRTQSWILESHSQFIKTNDVCTYLESKKQEYYNIFRSFCKGSSSAVVLAEIICDKLKFSMTDAVRNKTALNISNQIRCNVPAFKENRLNLEKHVLASLAKHKDFQRYVQYINNPKTYTEVFITEGVTDFIKSKNKECHSFYEQNISSINTQILAALHGASATTKDLDADIDTWLQEFTGSIKGELTFGTIDHQQFNDVNDFDFLAEEVEKGLKHICAELLDLTVDELEWNRQKPDQILIDQLCDCCWETCPFCRAVCTNTDKDHQRSGVDHSTPFHRSPSVRGFHYRNTEEMSLPFCTTKVAGDGSFHPDSSDRLVPYKSYRTAGPPYDTWSITPDLHQMCYWQWVVCTFKDQIEKHHNLRYTGRGTIPKEWKDVTFDQAMKNLEEMYK